MDKAADKFSEQTPATAQRKQGGCMGWGWPVTILIAVIFVIVTALSMPNIHVVSYSAKEAEVKQNIHAIQLAIERYAVDHEGEYPLYLIGGAARYSSVVPRSYEKFVDIRDCPDASTLSDPLLREGYYEGYWRNPFAPGYSLKIHRLQEKSDDLLRNGTAEAEKYGTRFGEDCTAMANIMPDRRYTKFTIRDSKGLEHTYPTFADAEYPCADMWREKRPTAFLPGEFFYRLRTFTVSNGSGVIQDYMLGGYGGPKTKGEDVIGPDSTGENAVTPFNYAASLHERIQGNPDGIADSVIIVLTAIWDD